MSRTRITPSGGQVSTTWEEQYVQALTDKGHISSAGLAEVQRCTDAAFRFIGNPSDEHVDSFVAGAIVGAVQSGKTGLMINLAARALDSGFRCVLVLAGLRDDLRTQTAVRFHRDLLWKGDRIPEKQGGGCTHPLGVGYHGARKDCWSPAVGDDVNHDEAFAHLLSSNLRRGSAALAVAKKNVTTLNHLSDALEYAISQVRGMSIPILVIDDECDEASVSADDDAPTPDRISEVWRALGQKVAYVGFTATPAANLLQDPASLLFPGKFVLTMRAPGESESNLTYLEANPDSRYTGGQAYYQLLEAAQRPNFLVEASMSQEEFDGLSGHDEALENALLAYFVSGAIRLVEQGLPDFDDPTALPLPHTMLAHTESTITSHWQLCQRIASIVEAKAGQSTNSKLNISKVRPKDRIKADDLMAWLDREPNEWRNWYDRFKGSRRTLLEVSPDRMRKDIPSWDVVVEALEQVFDEVKLRVVNSDDAAVDDPLQFQPTYTSAGPQPPRDIYSIVIGGNRLSRGLTIEGLCISYYTRMAIRLVEDTTVQRERWFGYRGSHLEFCRVFTHRSLAVRLSRFHEHDEDLRKQLAWNISNGRSPSDATFRFLTIRDSVPTMKLGRGQGPLQLDVSGSRPFIDRVQMGEKATEKYASEFNQAHALQLSKQIHSKGRPLKQSGNTLGYVLEDVSANYIADVLDGFTYTLHNPDPTKGIAWTLKEYYREPDPNVPVTEYSFSPSSDPYIVAAFLRLWGLAYEDCARNPAANEYRGADGVSDWIPCPPPKFNLAVRYGSLDPEDSSPFEFQLIDRVIDVEGRVGSRWGGRGGGVGDEWIDIAPPNQDPEAPRSRNMPGLLLLHVIGRQATGRGGYGEAYDYDRPCVGLVIPEGCPSHEVVIAQ